MSSDNFCYPIGYSSRGYIPTKSFFKNIVWSVVGFPSLLKRLQWSDIFDALNLRSSDNALDFGCGSGYMTYGMANICKKAVGIDVGNVANNIVPAKFREKLSFIQVSGENLPFEDSSFDVVLMSEVLPMIDDPMIFMKEVSRVVKQGGRVVLVNPVSRKGLLENYKNNTGIVCLMKLLGKAPSTYDEYNAAFQEKVGTAWRVLKDENYYRGILEQSGYSVDKVTYSPKAASQNLYERAQFFSLCMGWRVVSNWYFLLYPLCKFCEKFIFTQKGSGCIMVGRKL